LKNCASGTYSGGGAWTAGLDNPKKSFIFSQANSRPFAICSRNITTIINPNYTFCTDSGLLQIPVKYEFYKNKYTGTTEEYLDVLLRYCFYLIIKLIYAKVPEIINKPEEEIKILLGFNQEVEQIYNNYYSKDFTLFLNEFATSSYLSRKLIFEIYECEACYTNPNSFANGGPGPFPVDVDGTSQEYLNQYREPLKYNLLRVNDEISTIDDNIKNIYININSEIFNDYEIYPLIE
jgi:hypothetical protein